MKMRPFAQFVYLYKLKNVKNTHGGVHGCFSRFSNYTNDTKFRKASEMIIMTRPIDTKFGKLQTK